MLKVSPQQKQRSIITKEEWREFTKTVWHIANVAMPLLRQQIIAIIAAEFPEDAHAPEK